MLKKLKNSKEYAALLENISRKPVQIPKWNFRPTLLYGSETWVTTTRDMTTRLEAAEMSFLKSVKGYTRLAQ